MRRSVRTFFLHSHPSDIFSLFQIHFLDFLKFQIGKNYIYIYIFILHTHIIHSKLFKKKYILLYTLFATTAAANTTIYIVATTILTLNSYLFT